MPTNTKTYIRVPAPLPLQGTRNTRSLGGYCTQAGTLTQENRFLRSDGLQALSAQDIALLQDWGVCCVLDLRSDREQAAVPSALCAVPGIDFYPLPLLDQAFSGLDQEKTAFPSDMGDVYVDLLANDGETFAKAFRLMARYSGQGAVLFNCAAGKDRTGVMAMLLLGLAGVSREQILADYAVSETNMQPLFAQQKADAKAKYGVDIPDSAFSSDPAQMEKALDYLAAQGLDVPAYLRRAGVDEQTLAVVKAMLVD